MSNRPRLKVDKPLGKKAEVPFNIQDWLKDGWKPVTRQELWEFISRMEVGRKMRNRWSSRLRRFGRWLWSKWTTKPIDPEDPLYR